MKLDADQLNSLCGSAIEAARKAGAHISATRPMEIRQDKEGDSLASQVLTEVDGQCQGMILETLEPTFAEFDLALLTEESPDDGSRLVKDYFWCIDPIDGTLPFIEGTSGYSTSIALISREGVPFIGVVYDPVEHTLYYAIRGQGAFRNEKPWTLGHTEGRLFMNTDRSVAEQPEYPALVAGLEGFGYGRLETTTHGGGVMNAIWALENAPACYVRMPKTEVGGGAFWDFGATACIYRELGAHVSDIHGDPLDLNQADSIYMNRKGILYATDAELARKILTLKEDLM